MTVARLLSNLFLFVSNFGETSAEKKLLAKTSDSRVTFRRWWLDCRRTVALPISKAFHILIYLIKPFDPTHLFGLNCPSNRPNPRVQEVRTSWRYWWTSLMDFHNFFPIHLFEVKESIPLLTFLLSVPGLSDLDKPTQWRNFENL